MVGDESSAAPQIKPEGSGAEGAPASTEHLNIKVTDNNNEVYFRIRKSTQLKKLIDTFCERQGKSRSSVRFLYDGERVNESDTPDALGMQDGDTLEVHQEQIGGC
ncbi:ubiquitin-related domain-containing protein [Dipodascopsis tothii]|uniref:ubiquitin-related domain-containing protein n=1 Tax=Dipodascopsis tothii TaxID=44089 RepID=UPI0034CDFA89